MLKRILISAAGAAALAAYAFAPQPAAAASWIGGAAAAARTAPVDLSDVTNVHYRYRRHVRHYLWGAPFAFAPYAYYYPSPSWHYRYFGPHKRRCGYTYYGYTCW
jgi:hypothetical protein